ncbi:f1a5a737-845c-471b-8a49-d32be81bea2e [Thermothielavioides terrestris]|uniref:FAD/NAD(P)-binding domain-containing protein n=2 Tax=Thermothielavioides terrestris TaxID=2587410 RepID=G2QTR4_THETT|nr:uncharacterized protein THITE_2039222 [Thermothielavioides terrestris NRRL 8126]AEO62774.1 hypothetical protein THITE_2039222 [Thermothielavioides terrestris NRRL 8126]SPQ21731.1 f1a5a737-845c-471b-8a49-d32be81bea2e [Thermothielavioides terrestris]
MTQTVVILGAGWAGLPLAHKLLKYTRPKTDLKVVLVTPNSNFFWNVAATRGLIPGEIPDGKLFLPIAPGFNRYPAGAFELVLGRAEGIDETANTVRVITNAGAAQDITYNQLVIATGSRISSGLPLKPIGSDQQTLDAWHALQQRVGEARSIVVAGAGPTGVEVAGELAAKYGRTKSITLIASGSKPLVSNAQDEASGSGGGKLNPSVLAAVDSDLQQLGVRLIRNARVIKEERHQDAEQAPATTAGPHPPRQTHKLILSDGSVLEADCYLPLFGVEVNTSFVPAHLLDERGNVRQDASLRAAGSRNGNIWALGDVGDTEPKQLTVTDAQVIHVAAALDVVLAGKEGAPVPVYTPEKKTMLFLALGRKFATGQIGGWKLWRFLVAWVKGRKLFVDTAEAYVGGTRLRHAAM